MSEVAALPPVPCPFLQTCGRPLLQRRACRIKSLETDFPINFLLFLQVLPSLAAAPARNDVVLYKPMLSLAASRAFVRDRPLLTQSGSKETIPEFLVYFAAASPAPAPAPASTMSALTDLFTASTPAAAASNQAPSAPAATPEKPKKNATDILSLFDQVKIFCVLKWLGAVAKRVLRAAVRLGHRVASMDGMAGFVVFLWLDPVCQSI
jgi:hypothetical protein